MLGWADQCLTYSGVMAKTVVDTATTADSHRRAAIAMARLIVCRIPRRRAKKSTRASEREMGEEEIVNQAEPRPFMQSRR